MSRFDQFKEVRTLVVGDVMLDRFVRGTVRRISPEAPVPVIDVNEVSQHPGGAANVARNIAEFSPHVEILGRVGCDAAADSLASLLKQQGIGTSYVIRSSTAVTSTKTRVVAQHQQVVRYDEEVANPLSSEEEAAALERLEGAPDSFDCVIVEDYAKGMLTPNLVNRLRELAAAGLLVTVDPNPRHPADWSGFTALKPNLAEACAAANFDLRLNDVADGDDLSGHPGLNELARRLIEMWRPRYLLLTVGEHGLMFAENGGRILHIPAKAQEVFDVSGAGDTAIAIFSLVLAAGGTGEEAARWANEAASIVVGKLGTATVNPETLARHLHIQSP
jgi:D-beta-D-heptose 7-phosphate kinase/D-beta-D-heptose 1-phosphate adenosyltransferase